MWGTDLTSVMTGEGQAAVFITVDHCSAECVGFHARRSADRFEALEPIRQGVREHFAAFGKNVASGLALRHDHGSQYVSHHFQAEIRFLGIASSPAFVREPEGNGCAERFIRVLKENLLWIRRFDTIEELRLALQAFRQTYNQTWIIERHGYRTPAEAVSTRRGPAGHGCVRAVRCLMTVDRYNSTDLPIPSFAFDENRARISAKNCPRFRRRILSESQALRRSRSAVERPADVTGRSYGADAPR